MALGLVLLWLQGCLVRLSRALHLPQLLHLPTCLAAGDEPPLDARQWVPLNPIPAGRLCLSIPTSPVVVSVRGRRGTDLPCSDGEPVDGR